ncbi:MAG: epoxyqueuosine reductase QueH [Clostridiales Family XIII bacterium]|jgi:predicted adenine nucleotide alpha hydrolase (AANH) superfamily ATPase|nr:epoxyqueuosine reductase QueH [Clostridiales Family XIII bacterium]
MDTEKKALNIENAVWDGAEDDYGAACFQEGRDKQLVKPSLLLHSCCGPCSTAVVERLTKQYRITIFFYNPNIYDGDEYERRRDAQIKFIDQFNRSAGAEEQIALIEGIYEPEVFEQSAAGLEHEPEGGARCTECFRLRLEKTAETAVMTGCDFFTTSLSVSPHKNHGLIAKLGNAISVRYGICFISDDFKKKDGYRRSVELAAKYGLYRQNYCGCRFAAGACTETGGAETSVAAEHTADGAARAACACAETGGAETSAEPEL